MLARRVQRAAAPLAAVAALTLCLLTGSGVRAAHLDGDFHGEHERVGVARKVADLAISNLNAVEQPTDELYTLGRVLSVDNAVNHAYKSVVPRGLFLSLAYEAIKNSTKQTAYCNVEVWETLRGDITLEVNSCDFTVKAGTPTSASFTDPWSEGFAQDGTSAKVRSSILAAKAHYFPAETVVYSCSARVMSESMVDRNFLRYFVNLASTANCTDAVAAEILYSPEDEFHLVLPPVMAPQVSLVVKIVLCIVCLIIWGGLWFYHAYKIKQLKAEATVQKAQEAEMEKMEKIKEGLEAEN